MQHLKHQSKVCLTAKPNLCLIKGISFIFSLSTGKEIKNYCDYWNNTAIVVIEEKLTSFRCDQTNISSHQKQIYCTINDNNLWAFNLVWPDYSQISLNGHSCTCKLCPFPTKDHIVNITILFPSYFLFPKFCHKQTVHKFFK